MVSLRQRDTPTSPVYRVGRAPDPLAWIHWEYHGKGRFDGPRRAGRFRTMYFAERRLGAFIEVLADFRLDFDALKQLDELPDGDYGDDIPRDSFGRVPADWHQKRRIATALFGPDQKWLDLQAVETIQALREILHASLAKMRYRDLDFGDVLGRDRRLTRRIALLAYRSGFQGLCYCSRLDTSIGCWALFEESVFMKLEGKEIDRGDADLAEACRMLGLVL